MPQSSGAGRRAALAVLAALLLGSCAASGVPAEQDLRGHRLTVLATWADEEQERFARVVAGFERRTGARVRYTSAGHELPAVLDERLAAGEPPDVAFLPQPGLLRDHAAAGRLVPLDPVTRKTVERHYSPVFLDLASYQDRLYGVWFKAANKSLVWYDVAAFERRGQAPPADLPGLLALARQLAAEGTPAFAVSGADGWTLTDWFENLYVRLAGSAAYDALAAGRLAWTDPTVTRTLEVLAALLAPEHLVGGPAGALDTGFEESVEQVFGTAARAPMVMEGDFVAGVVAARTDALLGVHADAFPFPGQRGGTPVVVGGGDVAVLLRPSTAGSALLRHLASPEAAQVWAAAGGFVSPNRDVDLAVYPDEVTRSAARQLLEAGDDFRFDLSDLQPPAFGGAEDGGMRAALRSFLLHRDVAATTAQLAAARRAAGPTPATASAP